MSKSKHDQIAESIAKAHNAEYNPNKGADVVTPRQAIEVETDPAKFTEGIRQLQGYRQRRYMAVPDGLVEAAKQRTQGLQVGVMDDNGRVRKPAGKPK